ncbi:alpha/beta hydrolase [Arsenicitalea aurantiaca]|uniref:Alpha/beta hydrolase n=1 Tax=Arsenicitalea aurantiaca TaxID=1783274 RepID=A0A433XJZ5_9HYPH|nr:alpha/beta hydrolase [Arsenicitalea aurantiaca]RUT34393.1 alpha/beta hydrolase [Arsenicitalea aurantiaca]
MAFSSLALFDRLSPKDAGSALVGRDIAFGEGPRRRLDVYAPDRMTGEVPVVLFIYGGSWRDGDRRHYRFAGRALAAQGRICVIADYRVLPEISYPGFIEDGAAAIDWINANVGNFGGDARRLALVGHSAGAYNAAMLALSPLFLDASARGALRGVVGLSGPYDFYPFDVETTRQTFSAAPEPLATQPVNLVRPGAPPMFLATGTRDRLVYPRNTIALAKALRAADVPVQERHYAGLGHPDTLLALGKILRFRAPLLAEIDAFLGRYLDPREPGSAQ